MEITFSISFATYIDDIFGIWTAKLTTEWQSFSGVINTFGILRWDITEIIPSTSINFLEMILSIVDGKVGVKTYQKDMIFHLYTPPPLPPTLNVLTAAPKEQFSALSLDISNKLLIKETSHTLLVWSIITFYSESGPETWVVSHYLKKLVELKI